MPATKTSQRALEEQERRRQFQATIPQCFCPRCTTLTYASDSECFDCGLPRPGAGWPPLDECPDSWVGETIEDRYLVTKPIAQGHGSRIYRADSRIIPRSFGIKIMDVTGGPSLDQEGLRRRLRREIEVLSSLRNPHIVSFYDIVELPADRIAFVMDLIDGVALDELVEREAPLDLGRSLGLLRQLANGVYEAHEAGLVHRDLKPSNVMVEKLPAGDDFVRILDFGVVWVRGTVRDTGVFDELPLFASPEQVQDESSDQRTDIYSIGALAFLLLTGRAPFSGDTMLDVVDAILEEELPSLRKIARRPFPQAVEHFVASLLARDRADRPDSLSSVIEELDELLRDADDAAPDSADLIPNPGHTAMGLIPTLGEASSPVLKLETSEMTEVSESRVERAPSVVACVRDEYAFLRDGEIVWVDGDGEHTTAWRPSTAVLAMAIADDFAVFTLEDGSVIRVRRDGEADVMFQDPRRTPMFAIATDRAGRSMVAGSESGRLYAYRGRGGWTRLGSGSLPVTAVGLSARGDQFAVARGGNVQIFSGTALSHTPAFPLPMDRPVLDIAFSSDDYLIAILTEGGTVILASVITGQEFMRLDSGDTTLRGVTFSADNHIMGLFRDGSRVVLRALT